MGMSSWLLKPIQDDSSLPAGGLVDINAIGITDINAVQIVAIA